MWKSIKGFENYEISECGEVRNTLTHKILKSTINSHGYPAVKLYRSPQKPKGIEIHRIVAQYFLNNGMPIPNGLEVNHIDANITNNDVLNLEIVTHKENMNHAVRKGLLSNQKGENNAYNKLSFK